MGRIIRAHDIGPATKRSARRPPGDDLAKGAQIRRNPKSLLGAAWGDTEGDDLIKYEQDAQRLRDFPDGLQEVILREDDSRVCHQGIKDDSREVGRVLLDERSGTPRHY